MPPPGRSNAWAYVAVVAVLVGGLVVVNRFPPRNLLNKPIPVAAGDSFANALGMRFRYCPPGTFLMGSPTGRPNFLNDNVPQHAVTFTQGFWMGETEVTQAQYRAVMGVNPSKFAGSGPEAPVDSVNWLDARAFMEKLSVREANFSYRLPTEAEWEYACRAGSTSVFNTGDRITTAQANFDGRYPYGGGAKGVFRRSTTAVRTFPANAWGIFDMHGNVWEWCEDPWHPSYVAAPADGSGWQGGDLSHRVLRGGSWFSYGKDLASAFRGKGASTARSKLYGFRVVCLSRTR